MIIEKYIEDMAGRVDRALEEHLARSLAIPARLLEAMRYAIFSGGKRLRPIILIASASAAGGWEERFMPAACAVEMIHTYSLIHDDLPAMDDASLRRGRATVHRAFDEAMAVLAGDALLTEAFYLLGRMGRSGEVHAGRAVEVVADMAGACGPSGMVGGQVLDVEEGDQPPTIDRVRKIHALKTAAFFEASARAGAFLAGAAPGEVKSLGRYGVALGRAFQVVDDLLDVEGDEAEVGKDVGADERQNKATFPALVGIDAARAEASALIREAVDALSPFDVRADPLREIARFAFNRTR